MLREPGYRPKPDPEEYPPYGLVGVAADSASKADAFATKFIPTGDGHDENGAVETVSWIEVYQVHGNSPR